MVAETETLTTLAAETVVLAVVDEADSDGTETVDLAVTEIADSADEIVTVDSGAELMLRQSEAALLLTRRALRTNSKKNATG